MRTIPLFWIVLGFLALSGCQTAGGRERRDAQVDVELSQPQPPKPPPATPPSEPRPEFRQEPSGER